MKFLSPLTALAALVLLTACGVDGAPSAPGPGLSVSGDGRFGVSTQ